MPVPVDRIIRSKRRTVALIVESDGSVTVRAPMRLSESAIQAFAEKHAGWVEKKKAEMLEYCELDTLAMYRLWQFFDELLK